MTGYKVVLGANFHGPIFDGKAEEAAHRVVDLAKQDLAEEGAAMLRGWDPRMVRSGRHTGAFAENIHVTTRGRALVIPGPMIKGTTWAPWLEGTSKRNRDSRFKGYHLFRRTAAALRARARAVTQKRLDEYLGQMGGR